MDDDECSPIGVMWVVAIIVGWLAVLAIYEIARGLIFLITGND